MWFAFPQLRGLGTSPRAVHYASASLGLAVAHHDQPVLGERLRRATDTVLLGPAADADDLLGAVDARELRPSMTLVARAAPGEDRFTRVLRRFYDGVPDPRTADLLADG